MMNLVGMNIKETLKAKRLTKVQNQRLNAESAV